MRRRSEMPSLIQQVRQLLEFVEQQYRQDRKYIEWLENTHRHLYPDQDIYTAYEKATGQYEEEE
jgi:hypothetical protein|tara:strand:- start:756 stop:947 length:192 start_codon:yes stop_codon:yes gene_type:complete